MPGDVVDEAGDPEEIGWRLKWFRHPLGDYSVEELDREDFDWAALDEEEARRWADYGVHLAGLLPELPASLAYFGPGVADDWFGSHDALIEWWADDLPASFTLQLLGDRSGGRAARVVVQYTGNVTLTGAPIDQVRTWLDSTRTEILREELDRAPGGRFEHRFRLWPKAAFGVTFDSAVALMAPADPSLHYTLARRRSRERQRSWKILSQIHAAAGSVNEHAGRALNNAHFTVRKRLRRR